MFPSNDELTLSEQEYINWHRFYYQEPITTIMQAETLALEAWRYAWKHATGIEHRAHLDGKCEYIHGS